MSRDHAVARPVLNLLQKRMIAARRVLAARGLNEAVTWSFLSEREAILFGGQRNPALVLANPISSELTDMRPTLIANLIAAVGRNQARGFQNLALFEVGQAYAGDRMEEETLRAGGVRQGQTAERHWSQKPRAVDLFDAKADALAVLEAAGALTASVQVVVGGASWLHPGRSGTIQMGPQNKLAVFGEIHPRILAQMDVKGPLVAFEVTLNAIPAAKSKTAARPALQASDLMPLSRDFAFVMDERVSAADVVKAAKGADRQFVSAVDVFDVFSGGTLPQGKKSLAIAVTLQPKEATLTDKEIEAISARIVAQVEKATGGTLRS
jgi:phenylalanyl-tRNA synthetase beta chain